MKNWNKLVWMSIPLSTFLILLSFAVNFVEVTTVKETAFRSLASQSEQNDGKDEQADDEQANDEQADDESANDEQVDNESVNANNEQKAESDKKIAKLEQDIQRAKDRLERMKEKQELMERWTLLQSSNSLNSLESIAPLLLLRERNEREEKGEKYEDIRRKYAELQDLKMMEELYRLEFFYRSRPFSRQFQTPQYYPYGMSTPYNGYYGGQYGAMGYSPYSYYDPYVMNSARGMGNQWSASFSTSDDSGYGWNFNAAVRQ